MDPLWAKQIGKKYQVKIYDHQAGPQHQWSDWYCDEYQFDGPTIVMYYTIFAMGDPTNVLESVMLHIGTGDMICVSLLEKGKVNAEEKRSAEETQSEGIPSESTAIETP